MYADMYNNNSGGECKGQCGVPECPEIFKSLVKLRKHIKEVSIAGIKYYKTNTGGATIVRYKFSFIVARFGY